MIFITNIGTSIEAIPEQFTGYPSALLLEIRVGIFKAYQNLGDLRSLTRIGLMLAYKDQIAIRMIGIAERGERGDAAQPRH
jgi:hypothetical protein